MRSNIVNNNGGASLGAGIYAYSSTVTGNLVSDNWTESEGGGIAASNSLVADNTVTGNAAGWAGGISAWDHSIVTGNVVSGNWTTSPWVGDGGGIRACCWNSWDGMLISMNRSHRSRSSYPYQRLLIVT